MQSISNDSVSFFFIFLFCCYSNKAPCNVGSEGYCEDPNSLCCRNDEVFINGGSLCDKTCADLNKACNIRPSAKARGCYCREGYARTRNGDCVDVNSKACNLEYDANSLVSFTGCKPANCERGE